MQYKDDAAFNAAKFLSKSDISFIKC